MDTDIAGRFKALAREDPKRIIFPEATDARIIEAAGICAREGICEPVLLGDKEHVAEAAKDAGVPLDGVDVRDPAEKLALDRYATVYAQRRGNIAESVARRVVSRNMLFGAMAVSTGGADGMVGGATCPTARIIEAGGLAIGYEPGISVPSSIFVMILPDDWPEEQRVLVYADAAINIDPTAEELADIAITTAHTTRQTLGMEPRLAMLSCSTKGSAVHPRIAKVQRATEIVRQKAPDVEIDGELQADSAIVPRVAQLKCPESKVAGRANVLIFPDLDSGNIAYKLTQYHGRAKAYGPLLQGFARPIADLSRGATVEDIVVVTAFTVVKAQDR
ncbi:phosphate acetyltransferase [Planctomycetota bacterium]